MLVNMSVTCLALNYIIHDLVLIQLFKRNELLYQILEIFTKISLSGFVTNPYAGLTFSWFSVSSNLNLDRASTATMAISMSANLEVQNIFELQDPIY